MAEVGFAALGENLGDGAVVAEFDLVIEIEEAPSEPVRDDRADGGLAGAHETGEDEAVKGHSFRRGCASCKGWICAWFRFGRHVESCCTHCRLRGLLVEADGVVGKRKTADPVGCGSVIGWVLLAESEKRTTPPGRWGIPVAIAKSAGGGVHVHRN